MTSIRKRKSPRVAGFVLLGFFILWCVHISYISKRPSPVQHRTDYRSVENLAPDQVHSIPSVAPTKLKFGRRRAFTTNRHRGNENDAEVVTPRGKRRESEVDVFRYEEHHLHRNRYLGGKLTKGERNEVASHYEN